MTMITPSYLGETIEYSSLHACRSTLEDPTIFPKLFQLDMPHVRRTFRRLQDSSAPGLSARGVQRNRAALE